MFFPDNVSMQMVSYQRSDHSLPLLWYINTKFFHHYVYTISDYLYSGIGWVRSEIEALTFRTMSISKTASHALFTRQRIFTFVVGQWAQLFWSPTMYSHLHKNAFSPLCFLTCIKMLFPHYVFSPA